MYYTTTEAGMSIYHISTYLPTCVAENDNSGMWNRVGAGEGMQVGATEGIQEGPAVGFLVGLQVGLVGFRVGM